MNYSLKRINMFKKCIAFALAAFEVIMYCDEMLSDAKHLRVVVSSTRRANALNCVINISYSPLPLAGEGKDERSSSWVRVFET